MDPNRRHELLERRKQLQEKVREQRERDAYYFDIRWVASELERLDVPFVYVHDLDPLADWLRANFRFLDEEIDWWSLDYRRLRRRRFRRQEDGELDVLPTRDAVIQRWLGAIRSQQSLPGERVTAFYGRWTPSLELSFEDVLRHPAAVFSRDCWLIPAGRTWVLQCTEADLVWTRPDPEITPTRD
jgi:hypothetical protein